MAFARPTLTEIRQGIESDIDARLPGADSRLRRSVLGVLAAAMAGAVHLVHGFIARLAGQIFPDTATGEYLERHAAVHDLDRKAAAFSAGNVDLTGTDGSELPAGAVLQRSDGAEFTTNALATIAAGVATVAVTASAAAVDGNTTAGIGLTVVSPPPGIDAPATVAAGDGLTGGTDAETDAALRDRLLARLRESPQGGAIADYEAWALEIAGVTRAFVSPLELGAGTVVVRIVDDNGAGTIVPDGAKIAEVQARIDALRPVTADVTVAAPVETAMAFTIQAVPDTTAVRDAIEASLTDLLRREGEPGATILISHIREAISTAAGETNHVLTVPNADVAHASNQIAVLGVITWV